MMIDLPLSVEDFLDRKFCKLLVIYTDTPESTHQVEVGIFTKLDSKQIQE